MILKNFVSHRSFEKHETLEIFSIGLNLINHYQFFKKTGGHAIIIISWKLKRLIVHVGFVLQKIYVELFIFCWRLIWTVLACIARASYLSHDSSQNRTPFFWCREAEKGGGAKTALPFHIDPKLKNRFYLQVWWDENLEIWQLYTEKQCNFFLLKWLQCLNC